MDKLKDSAADGKTKSHAQMGRVGSGPEFHVNDESGRVGSLYLWVGSRKLVLIKDWTTTTAATDMVMIGAM